MHPDYLQQRENTNHNKTDLLGNLGLSLCVSYQPHYHCQISYQSNQLSRALGIDLLGFFVSSEFVRLVGPRDRMKLSPSPDPGRYLVYLLGLVFINCKM